MAAEKNGAEAEDGAEAADDLESNTHEQHVKVVEGRRREAAGEVSMGGTEPVLVSPGTLAAGP